MNEGAAQRLAAVREQIASAAREARRDPASVRLIAVSKTFDAPAIVPVLDAGQRLFGENRVQEAKGKWPALKERYPEVELHLIGPLQTNKAREAVELFDCIHTLDRPKLAHALKKEIDRTGRNPSLMIEVNTGGEAQKAGVAAADLPALLTLARDDLKLRVTGLMCIPPVDEEAAIHFAFLSKLAREQGLAELSMGMSADFQAAIEQGATYVRVGSAIFGSRT